MQTIGSLIKIKEQSSVLSVRSKALYLRLRAIPMKASQTLLIDGSSSTADMTDQEWLCQLWEDSWINGISGYLWKHNKG